MPLLEKDAVFLCRVPKPQEAYKIFRKIKTFTNKYLNHIFQLVSRLIKISLELNLFDFSKDEFRKGGLSQITQFEHCSDMPRLRVQSPNRAHIRISRWALASVDQLHREVTGLIQGQGSNRNCHLLVRYSADVCLCHLM